MGKGEISWKGQFEDGRKRQAYAKRIGNQWFFFERERRFDSWAPMPTPPLEDWLELLDGVDRRVHRRLAQPKELTRIRGLILERYPGAELPPSSL